MKHVVIMTFPSWKWDEYGYCLKGFIEHWPADIQGYALVEKPSHIPIDIPVNMTVLDFDETVGLEVRGFEERNKERPIFDLGTTGNISKQAAKFARKVFAQLYVLENIDADVVWYIDADLYTHRDVSMKFLNTLASGSSYLGCTPRWWAKGGYTETGFMMWKKSMSDEHEQWCKLYRSCYDQDLIFDFDAWHDCMAFDYATKTLLKRKIIKVTDFGNGIKSSHPLVSGPLGKWFDHMKGNRKFVGFSSERLKAHGDGN